MVVTFSSIGTIHSPFKDAEAVPEDPANTRTVKGSVEVDPKFTSELQGIGEFTHIILVYHFHLSSIYAQDQHAQNTHSPAGIFATRSAARVNPIGVSVVRLLGTERNKLLIEGIDVVDGTPLLDIKPYVAAFDALEQHPPTTQGSI